MEGLYAPRYYHHPKQVPAVAIEPDRSLVDKHLADLIGCELLKMQCDKISCLILKLLEGLNESVKPY